MLLFVLLVLLLRCGSTNYCNPQVLYYKMLSHYLRPSLSVPYGSIIFELLPFESCYISEN